MFLPHFALYQVKQAFVGTANIFGVADVDVWTNFGYTRPSSEALKKLWVLKSFFRSTPLQSKYNLRTTVLNWNQTKGWLVAETKI